MPPSDSRANPLTNRPEPAVPHTEDFDFFYDAIHGRVSFHELPVGFPGLLRAALNSRFINRLTRISQLGYTSLTFFSATQTRFSHAVGTLIMLNRLMHRVWPYPDLPQEVLAAVIGPNGEGPFQNAGSFGDKGPSNSVRCHLLIAALYQDVGELPFQKITSLYILPHQKLAEELSENPAFAGMDVQKWTAKQQFTIAALVDDFKNCDGFGQLDSRFLAYLISGGLSNASDELKAVRQMLDGVVDADRLDYVFRDAHLTIGSLTKPDTIVQSIVEFTAKGVVVNDPRPITDFLTTRARLWSFVYAAPAVRFRQTLFKSFLRGAFAAKNADSVLHVLGGTAGLSLAKFEQLDDHSFLAAIPRFLTSSEPVCEIWRDDLDKCAEKAAQIITSTVTEYRCRILLRPEDKDYPTGGISRWPIPATTFFDPLFDHEGENRLYTPGSVEVEQSLTQALAPRIALERCAGALSPVFTEQAVVPLVNRSFFVFVPQKPENLSEYSRVLGAVDSDSAATHKDLFFALAEADAKRDLKHPPDTWVNSDFQGKRIAISCCFEDRSIIAAIIGVLNELKQKYRVLVDALIGLDQTPMKTSEELIQKCDGVLVVMSRAYIKRWIEQPETEKKKTYIKREVEMMLA